MFRLTKITQFIILIFALSSCEYNLSKWNFVDIQAPAENQIFNLNLIPGGEVIKIFKETTLNYNINTNGLDVLQATFTFQDSTWRIYSNEGSITVNPLEFKVGMDTLKLAVYLNSGTGSIADKMTAEGYYIEKKWVVALDGRPAPKLIPTKSINENGFLKIEWPKCEQLNFISYRYSASSGNRSVRKKITDVNHTFYVDSLYVGGDYYVTVYCDVENSYPLGQSLNLNDVPPLLKIKEIGFDSLQISWKKSPYKAKYRLSWNHHDPLYFNSSEDTICTIAQIGFGNWTTFRLSIKSQYQEAWEDLSYGNEISSFTDYYMGTRLIGANFPEFGYNRVEKTLYSNLYNTMQSFNINTYSLYGSVRLEDLITRGAYTCPTNSSKVATKTLDKIYIFKNNKLEAPIIIEIGKIGAYATDHFLLTNKDIIACAANKAYILVDINTKRILTSIDIPDYPIYSKWACISTSQDANFMCVATQNGIKIYKIENGQLVESFSDKRNYRSAYFNPNNPNQLYLTLNNQRGIEIRNPSNFNLENIIDIPSKMVIQNIDLETNNILITDYERLFIINIDSHRILLTIPCDENKAWLYNNKLFTNSGYALDISEKL